jgi:hypothetical protein
MILDAAKGLAGQLWDAAAGSPIPHAVWANTDTGDYIACRVGPDGERLRSAQGSFIHYRGHSAQLRFVPTILLPGAAKPTPVRAPVLPKAPRGSRLRRVDRRCLILEDRPCEAYACIRLAEYETADVRDLEPSVGQDGRRFRRREVVARHYWCPWHYRNPAQVHPDGSADGFEVTARPQ